jgi:penicillin-binding protein 2
MGFQLPDDDRFPAWRIAFFQYLIAASLMGLLVGYWRLQIGQHRAYLELAERNRVRNLPIIAPRGQILDREGRTLVDSHPAFSILLMREGSDNPTPERLAEIASSLGIDAEEIQELQKRAAGLPPFQSMVLKQSATIEDIAFVESHRVEFPELNLIQVQQRFYPKGSTGAAVLGYVGEVSEDLLSKPGSPYRPGDVVGKSGVERTYNSVLTGQDGMRRIIVNSRGQEIGSMTTIKPRLGNDLRLTLDLDLQMVAEAGLGGESGAVVALDPRTGEILAMVSHPSYDPNEFARRMEPESWQKLISDPQKPLMNKAIQAHIAPGSVFKIITATAALETGTIKPEYSLYCPGWVTIYGHTYHDWTFKKGRGHGHVDLHEAIVQSCDVYFYTLGKLLGIEKIGYFAKRLGLGSRTGIDLPAEEPGLVPSPDWVKKTLNRPWWPGETISVAIGQGAVAATPLQMACAIGGIASGGTFRRPHVAFRDQLRALGIGPEDEDAESFPLNESTIDVLTRGMWGVVNEGGTGARARYPGLDIAGKTGTAQVVSMALMESSKKKEHLSNAWFVGYAPSTNPEIVVAALVMHGNESAVAVPIARDVIRAYFDKKMARKPIPGQMETRVRMLSELNGPTSGAAQRESRQR